VVLAGKVAVLRLIGGSPLAVELIFHPDLNRVKELRVSRSHRLKEYRQADFFRVQYGMVHAGSVSTRSITSALHNKKKKKKRVKCAHSSR
jgi:hypothetical protein